MLTTEIDRRKINKTTSLNSFYLPPTTKLLHIMERINIIFITAA